MTVFLIIVVVVVIILLLAKNNKKQNSVKGQQTHLSTSSKPTQSTKPKEAEVNKLAPIESDKVQEDLKNQLVDILRDSIKISVGTSSFSTPKPPSPPSPTGKAGEFIINPGDSFPLTVTNTNEDVAKRVSEVLNSEDASGASRRDILTSLFALHNISVKEIDEYRAKYGKIYRDKIESLKSSSSEWSISGELDREDLLKDYRKIALDSLYEKANGDLTALFELEPSDATIDDELIKEYGFDNFQTYLYHVDKLDKVYIIQNDEYRRPRFEKLVEIGLAIRGSSIPVSEVLPTLTLKDLNAIAQNPDKEFKRKNQAIDYIMSQGNVEERVGKRVSMRELFKLQPLPDKFSAIDLEEVSKSWRYTSSVVDLLVETFQSSRDTDNSDGDDSHIKCYKVNCWSNEESKCQRAREIESKVFDKSQKPVLPFHVGCNCHLNREYDFQ